MTNDAPEIPKEEEFKPVLSRPWSEDNGSLVNKIPVLPSLAHDLLGWKNWKIGDWFMGVEDARTPRPEEGKFDDNEKNTPGLVSAFLSGDIMERDNCYNPVKYPEMETVAQHLSRRFHSASLNNFLTDLGSNLHNAQMSTCMDFEMQAMECIEYYGAKQGLVACKDWYDDYIECTHNSKQQLRMKAMFKKRHIDNHLEYLQGKRTWAETYEPTPKAFAFIEPWHNPKFAKMQEKEM